MSLKVKKNRPNLKLNRHNLKKCLFKFVLNILYLAVDTN